MRSQTVFLAGAIALATASGWAQTSPPNAVVPSAPAAFTSVSLTETHWNLSELDGAAVVATSAENQPYVYLQQPGDKLSGSGGCNRILGSFDLSGASLQFHSVASTRMACPGDSMEHEAALLEALRMTDSFQITGTALQLRVGDRVLARFEAEKKK